MFLECQIVMSCQYLESVFETSKKARISIVADTARAITMVVVRSTAPAPMIPTGCVTNAVERFSRCPVCSVREYD